MDGTNPTQQEYGPRRVSYASSASKRNPNLGLLEFPILNFRLSDVIGNIQIRKELDLFLFKVSIEYAVLASLSPVPSLKIAFYNVRETTQNSDAPLYCLSLSRYEHVSKRQLCVVCQREAMGIVIDP